MEYGSRGVLIMKCVICGEDACYSIPHYKGAKNKIVKSYEYRCRIHMDIGRKLERKLLIAKRANKLDYEINKLFPVDIISEPTAKISKPSA